jgi:hypothetical protein
MDEQANSTLQSDFKLHTNLNNNPTGAQIPGPDHLRVLCKGEGGAYLCAMEIMRGNQRLSQYLSF